MSLKSIIYKYYIIFSFYYRINRKYYKTGHLNWTTANCIIIFSGFFVTLIFTLIYIFNLSLSSDLLMSIALSILGLVSVFVFNFNFFKKDLIESLKQEEEYIITLAMKIVHFLSIALSFFLTKLLYLLCTGQNIIW